LVHVLVDANAEASGPSPKDICGPFIAGPLQIKEHSQLCRECLIPLTSFDPCAVFTKKDPGFSTSKNDELTLVYYNPSILSFAENIPIFAPGPAMNGPQMSLVKGGNALALASMSTQTNKVSHPCDDG